MIGIVILNYNNTTDIINCIESISKCVDTTDLKVVIVDNGSEVAKRDFVGEYLSVKYGEECQIIYDNSYHGNASLSKFTYLLLAKNCGYARGNNAGINLLLRNPEVTEIMILNSDILFSEDVVHPLVPFLRRSENVGAVSPLLFRPNGNIDYTCARKSLTTSKMLLTFSYLFSKVYISAIEEHWMLKSNPSLLDSETIQIDLPSGSCMLFKAETLKRIGGFDSGTFLYYEEDILYQKLKRQGFVNLLIPSLSCIHLGGATTCKEKTSYFLKKCNYQSLLYYLKNYTNCTAVQLLYFRLTACLRLFRLWLGMIYHRFVDAKIK